MAYGHYTPEFVNQHFATVGEAPNEPGGARFSAAALWCDIVGYTPLTEKIVAAGPEGVETLTSYLNAYYARLIEVVLANGGDIIQFEGDAMLAVWRATGEPESLGALTQRAAQTSLELQEALQGFTLGDIAIRQRIAVGVGSLRLFWVGGVLARWTIVAAGDPLVQVQTIDHDPEPGQCVLSPEAWSLVQDVCVGRPLARCTLLESIPAPLPRRPLARVEFDAARNMLLRRFLPGSVLSRLDAGQSKWLAELRTLSILFLQMPDLDSRSDDVMAVVQRVTEEVQRAVYRWGGALNKLSLADKGAALLCAFGVPPLAHEDNSLRAVNAALDIVRRLAAAGIRCGVGVTTGQCFCGLVGSDQRTEYTALGSPVNIASRLMSVADGSVVVDEATFRATEHRLVYDVLPRAMVKGVSEPLAMFRPTGDGVATLRKQTEIIGRRAELDAISARLQYLLRERRGSLLVLEGEGGIGKSRIVTEAIRFARELDVRVVMAEAMGIERDTPYFAWRRATRDLLGLGEVAEQSVARAKVAAAFAGDPDLEALTPLLNVLLPLDLDETAETIEMVGEVRANSTLRLLETLLARAADAGPVMLVIEDAHWLDSASWATAAALARDVRPLFVLVATRPIDQPPGEYAALLRQDGAEEISVDRLSPDETMQIVCQRLGVLDLAFEVEKMLLEKADGNPFFSEELAYSLRDSGHLLISHEIAGLAPGVDLAQLTLPTTVQDAIVSRVDRLAPAEQLLLKVASVIGREFLVRLLAAIYAEAEGHGEVESMLPGLVELQLLLEEPAEDPTYVFKHALSRSAVYELMLFAQRRVLHRVVAEWLERNVEDLEPLYPLLANHWSQTEDAARSAEFCYRAGMQALQRYANREAVRFLTRSLELAVEHPELSDEGRAVEMEEALSKAWFAIGDVGAAEGHACNALALLGTPVARTLPGKLLGTLGAVLMRAWRNHAVRAHSEEGKEAARWQSAARIGTNLTEMAMYAEDNLGAVYHLMRQLLAADRAGPSPELARAYTVYMTVLGATPLRRVADAAMRRALDTVVKLDSRLHRAWVYSRVAVYDIYGARWDRANARCDEAIELTERLNDRRVREEALGISGLALLYAGRLDEADARMHQMMQLAGISGNDQAVAWGTLARAECMLRFGRADEALRQCEAVRAPGSTTRVSAPTRRGGRPRAPWRACASETSRRRSKTPRSSARRTSASDRSAIGARRWRRRSRRSTSPRSSARSVTRRPTGETSATW